MARRCYGRYKKKLKVKNRKETAKDRRTWRDLAERAKTHEGLQCQMMMMMIPAVKRRIGVYPQNPFQFYPHCQCLCLASGLIPSHYLVKTFVAL